ncbi:MAG TPA: type II CAAX endopeptidase family protein [Clostridia bacterium]|nr:type II CAAX endopeptidase family protein [Clostridia bacterium]
MKKFFLALLKALCYTLLFFGMQLVVVTAAGVVFGMHQSILAVMNGGTFDFDALTTGITDFLLENANLLTVISSALSLFLLWPVFAAGKKNYLHEVSLVPVRPDLAPAAAILLGLSFAFVLSIVLDLLPIPESVWEEYAEYSYGITEADHPLLGFFAAVIVAPVTEEIFFRGLVYTRLKRGMPTAIAVLLESAIFGLLHGTALWIAYAFLLGVIMTLIFEKFGSILVNMAFHAAFNLAGGYFVTMVDTESPVAYWAAFAIAAAVAIGASAWLISMPRANAMKPAGERPE